MLQWGGQEGWLARAETSSVCTNSTVAAVTFCPLWMVSSWWRGEGSSGESGARRTRCRIGLCISASSHGSTQSPLLLGKPAPTSSVKQTTPFTILSKTLSLTSQAYFPFLWERRVFILFSVTMSEVHITHDALEQG